MSLCGTRNVTSNHGVSDGYQVDPCKGLFRTKLAGPGRTLADAFASLEKGEQGGYFFRHPGLNLFSARVDLREEEGEGHWDFIRIRNDIYLVIEDYAYRDRRTELLSGDGLVQFHFKLSGELTLAVSPAEAIRLSQPTLMILHHHQGAEIREWTTPNARTRGVAVCVSPRYLQALFESTPGAMPPKLDALLTYNDRTPIQYLRLPLCGSMFELVAKVVDNAYTGVLGVLQAEALVLQLLCLTVTSFCAIPATPLEPYTQRELSCLHAARQILMSELSTPPTIRQVARMVGINDTILKRGFKSVFGETMFNFSLRCRMERALTLLRNGRVHVSDVAQQVGYRHQTSFATAFRRHFRIRPKDVRPGRSA